MFTFTLSFLCVFLELGRDVQLPFLPSCTACPYPLYPSYLVFYLVILGGFVRSGFLVPSYPGPLFICVFSCFVPLHGWLNSIYNVINHRGQFLLTTSGGGLVIVTVITQLKLSFFLIFLYFGII